MAKASPTQAWLWHRRLSYLNFDYINLLSKKDVMIGLPKLKYVKNQLCSSCEVSKAKRSSFKTKTVPSSKGRLNLLHMDLCGPMRVASINGKKYILVARTTLSAFKLHVFFWVEAIATTCYTQNRFIIIVTHEKMAYHIINDRKPSIKHLHIFGCTCYRTRDGENLDKMKEKGYPCILVGYFTQLKGYRVYNKRTRLIVESIHLKFDEIKEMSEMSVANDTSGLILQRQKASDYDNSDPILQLQNVSPSADTTVPLQQELGLLFGPLYDEFFNTGTSRVNKSSFSTDNSIQQDTLPSTNIHPTTEPSTPTHVSTEENNNDQAEFTNPFYTQVQEVAESSSCNIGTEFLNKTLNAFFKEEGIEHQTSTPRTLDQNGIVERRNHTLIEAARTMLSASKLPRTRLIVESIHLRFDEIKEMSETFVANDTSGLEVMSDSAWIEAMQEDFIRFERLQSLEHVDKPLAKNETNLKWIWKNKKDEDQLFSNADQVGCIDYSQELSGGIQFLGEKLVSWMSKKQDCTAMSSAEAEYVALSASCAQVMWMRTQLKEICASNYNKIPYVIATLRPAIGNLMQPSAVLPYQAHPYSISFHQGIG
ncbi:retrovirus-related pol polyprotein from transposon TNT 1-94 [Tanacetum coccineum]